MTHLFRFVVIFCAGCAIPGPRLPTGVPATGEPLAVVDDVRTWTTTEQEKVGETKLQDSSGTTIATADVYAQRDLHHSLNIWYPMQGRERLSDEDFFRIAGDRASLETTEQMRSRGATWHRAGIVALVGGLCAVTAGAWMTGSPQLTRALVTGGGAMSMSIGYFALDHGKALLDADNHAVDRSVADAAARQYDERLGRAVGVGASGHF